MTEGEANLTGHRENVCVCDDQECIISYYYIAAGLLYFFLNPNHRSESKNAMSILDFHMDNSCLCEY